MKTKFNIKVKELSNRLEDIFMTATYAEAADLRDLRNAFNYETELVRPDDCQYGDNELCYNES